MPLLTAHPRVATVIMTDVIVCLVRGVIARPRVDRGDACRKMDAMRPQTLLLVSSDHPQAAALRAALTRRPVARVVGDVRGGAEALRAATRLRPDAILLVVDLPGRLYAPLARDLHVASPASRLIVVGARRALDRALLLALLDLGVSGCLAWEETRIDALPSCVAAALDSGALVCSPGLLATLLTAFDRRSGPRVEGLVLLPEERDAQGAAPDASGAPFPVVGRAALWADDPAITAGLRLHCAQVGLALDAVDTAPALLDAARHAALLFVDCAAAPDALDRCLTIVPHTTLPVYIRRPAGAGRRCAAVAPAGVAGRAPARPVAPARSYPPHRPRGCHA